MSVQSVPALSILFMALALVISVALPVGLGIYFYKVKKADPVAFFVGCGVMILFAFVLESAVHRLVLNTRAGAALRENVWLYALYGGAMAGLFEEGGRFLAFRTLLRKRQTPDANALMYGAGHGGIEAFVILGITSVNNIVYSVILNTGSTEMLTASLPEEVLKQVEEVFQALVSTPPWQFLLGGAERILAVILQLSLSVLVWFAAKKNDRILLFPLAILIHLIVDAVTVILSEKGVSPLPLEGVVAVFAAIAALVAGLVWKKNAEPGPEKTTD